MQIKRNEKEQSFLKRLLIRLTNERSRKIDSKKILNDVEETLRVRLLYLKKGRIEEV